jgi:hypothetical protein
MATTYTTEAFKSGPWYGKSGNLVYRNPTRVYVVNDVVKLWKIERDVAIVEAFVHNGAAGGASTTEVDLQLTDGTTTVTLIDGAALDVANVRTAINVATSNGYTVPTSGFWLQLKPLVVATATTTILTVGLILSGVRYGDSVL